jgi:hypothetical protein
MFFTFKIPSVICTSEVDVCVVGFQTVKLSINALIVLKIQLK